MTYDKIELDNLREWLTAVFLLHDALCSKTPTRDYDQSEIDNATEFVLAFSRQFGTVLVGKALARELSDDDREEVLRVGAEVQAKLEALGESE